MGVYTKNRLRSICSFLSFKSELFFNMTRASLIFPIVSSWCSCNYFHANFWFSAARMMGNIVLCPRFVNVRFCALVPSWPIVFYEPTMCWPICLSIIMSYIGSLTCFHFALHMIDYVAICTSWRVFHSSTTFTIYIGALWFIQRFWWR